MKNDDSKEKNYLEVIDEASKLLPGLELPTYGITNNEKIVKLNIEDYLNNNDSQSKE